MNIVTALFKTMTYKKPIRNVNTAYYCPICRMRTDTVHCMCQVSYITVNQPVEGEETSYFPPTTIRLINCDEGTKTKKEVQELKRRDGISWDMI